MPGAVNNRDQLHERLVYYVAVGLSGPLHVQLWQLCRVSPNHGLEWQLSLVSVKQHGVHSLHVRLDLCKCVWHEELQVWQLAGCGHLQFN